MCRIYFFALLLITFPVLALDSDNDGLTDEQEIEAGLPPDVADTDGDGIFDAADTDMDGDGILNTDECSLGAVATLALKNGGLEKPYCACELKCMSRVVQEIRKGSLRQTRRRFTNTCNNKG